MRTNFKTYWKYRDQICTFESILWTKIEQDPKYKNQIDTLTKLLLSQLFIYLLLLFVLVQNMWVEDSNIWTFKSKVKMLYLGVNYAQVDTISSYLKHTLYAFYKHITI